MMNVALRRSRACLFLSTGHTFTCFLFPSPWCIWIWVISAVLRLLWSGCTNCVVRKDRRIIHACIGGGSSAVVMLYGMCHEKGKKEMYRYLSSLIVAGWRSLLLRRPAGEHLAFSQHSSSCAGSDLKGNRIYLSSSLLILIGSHRNQV